MDLPENTTSTGQPIDAIQTSTHTDNKTSQSNISMDKSDLQLLNNDEDNFTIQDDHSSIVAQAVRALSEDTQTTRVTEQESNDRSSRKRPRRAASKKATDNLSKLISLEEFTQFSKENNDNIDVSITAMESTNTETDNARSTSKHTTKMSTTKRKNAKTDSGKKTTNSKKNSSNNSNNNNDDDDDFVLIESESEHELEDDSNLVDDDLAIDNSLREDENYIKDEVVEESSTSKKKRGRKSKSTAKQSPVKKSKPTPKLHSTPRQKSILVAKNRIVRQLKDLSGARDKVERIYGVNSERLLPLAKVKEGFEKHLFDFPKSIIDSESEYYVNVKPLCAKYTVRAEQFGLKETHYKQLDEESLQQLFTYRKSPLDVIIGDTETSLDTGKKVEFPVFQNGNRKGFVYNVGGLITDMAWLNSDSSENHKQYLAVAISQHSENPADPHLEMFDKEKHVSCIEIIEFNPETLGFVKLQTILHNFGETWNLKWHEGYYSETDLGFLTFASQDGSVKGIQIKMAETKLILECERPSISISLMDTSITCFDFLSPELIICGFKNGYVAEFDIFDSTNIPSYYHKVHDSYIVSLVVSYSPFETTTVASIAVDGYFHVYDTRDIYSTKCTFLRLRGNNIMPAVFSPQLSLVVFSDASNSVRCVTAKASFASHNVISKESTVISLGTARFHPMLLTGTADGKVYVENLARKILTGIKNSTAIHKSLKLWEWEYNVQTKQYRLDNTYDCTKSTSGEINRIGIHPSGTAISAAKWNETKSGCKFFAFSNTAGLLTIEGLPLE